MPVVDLFCHERMPTERELDALGDGVKTKEHVCVDTTTSATTLRLPTPLWLAYVRVSMDDDSIFSLEEPVVQLDERGVHVALKLDVDNDEGFNKLLHNVVHVVDELRKDSWTVEDDIPFNFGPTKCDLLGVNALDWTKLPVAPQAARKRRSSCTQKTATTVPKRSHKKRVVTTSV